MEPNKLEQEFRDKLEQRTIQPSQMAWDRLDAMLSVNEEKDNKVISIKKPQRKSWMYMAASFIVFATAGTFFLTRESGKGTGAETEKGASVVTIKNTAQPQQNSNPADKEVEQPANYAPVPAETQTAVASAHPPLRVKGNASGTVRTSIRKSADNISVPSPEDNQRVAVVAHEEPNRLAPGNGLNDMAAVNTANQSKKKSTVKVDANSLLSSVEGELNESFREKAFDGVVKNFNVVKTAVANRNYQ